MVDHDHPESTSAPLDEERAQRRAQDRERLEQAARELLSSEGWQRWTAVRSRNGLARYSLGNQLLIAMQAPDARFVAGFHVWKGLGRRVAKGQHGIRILARIPVQQRDATNHEQSHEDGTVRVLFKSLAVFDTLFRVCVLGPSPARFA